MGIIEKRHDDLWGVRPWHASILGKEQQEIAASRKDAVSLMAEKTTTAIPVSLNGNPPANIRVYLPKGYIGSETEPLEFWSKPESMKKDYQVAFALPCGNDVEDFYQ